MAITFINADLEIYSDYPLDNIHSEFMIQDYRFMEMYHGKVHGEESYLSSFEIHPECGQNGEFNEKYSEAHDFSSSELIEEFIESISSLGRASQNEWERASKRVIDLGYLSDNNCASLSDQLSSKLLMKMANLSIDLVLTYYPEVIGEA